MSRSDFKNLNSINHEKIIQFFNNGVSDINCVCTKNDQRRKCGKKKCIGFHAIQVGGGIDLYLSQGDEAVAVSASKKYRDKIITEVKDGILKYMWRVKINLNMTGAIRKLKAYVSFKDLDGLEGIRWF